MLFGHLRKMLPGQSPVEFYQEHAMGPAREIISYSWLRILITVCGYPRRSQNLCWGIEKSGMMFSACFHHDPHQEK